VGTAQPSRVSRFVATVYAAFFNFAHLARCAAAIFLRADADIARFTGASRLFSLPLLAAIPSESSPTVLSEPG
jgi:hypothetical protein